MCMHFKRTNWKKKKNVIETSMAYNPYTSEMSTISLIFGLSWQWNLILFYLINWKLDIKAIVRLWFTSLLGNVSQSDSAWFTCHLAGNICEELPSYLKQMQKKTHKKTFLTQVLFCGKRKSILDHGLKLLWDFMVKISI